MTRTSGSSPVIASVVICLAATIVATWMFGEMGLIIVALVLIVLGPFVKIFTGMRHADKKGRKVKANEVPPES